MKAIALTKPARDCLTYRLSEIAFPHAVPTEWIFGQFVQLRHIALCGNMLKRHGNYGVDIHLTVSFATKKDRNKFLKDFT